MTAAEIPVHLRLARDFVAHTRPEDNRYVNRNGFTRAPGDPVGDAMRDAATGSGVPGNGTTGNETTLGTGTGAARWIVSTDCSGFVDDIFRRAALQGEATPRVAPAPGRRRPLTRDFHAAISRGEGFTTVDRITDARAGDVVAWLYMQGEHRNPGHILFLDSAPERIEPQAPIVDGLAQYRVAVVDTSQEAKSRDDTRYVADPLQRASNRTRGVEGGTMASPNRKGVGRGHMRFYADDGGRIRGAAFDFPQARFHPAGSDWNIVAGRVR